MGWPTERTLHSSDVAWIDHPSWRLIWALNCLTDPDGNVLVEGWYDDCRPPTDEEIDRLWAEEAERRVSQIEEGKAKLVPGEEVFAKIRTKHGK